MSDSRVHLCATCGRPNAHQGVAGQWFCREHTPTSYWPHNREAGQ